MDKNTELLNYIYQNAQMGLEVIPKLLEICDDPEFSEQLNTQLAQYKEINERAKTMLHNLGHDELRISAFEKIKTYFFLNLQTLSNKSTSHLAEMMIIGSNMGVIDAIKKQKKYSDSDPNIINLIKNLQTNEEKNMEILKKYL